MVFIIWFIFFYIKHSVSKHWKPWLKATFRGILSGSALFANVGNPRDTKRWSSGRILYPTLTLVIDSYNLCHAHEKFYITVWLEASFVVCFCVRFLSSTDLRFLAISAAICIVFSSSASIVIYLKTIRICHECWGRMEKSVSRIAVWHHEACRVITNGDLERRIFLSYAHTNNGFFFLHLFIWLF